LIPQPPPTWTARPNGMAPDIGAYEYAATPFSCSGDNVIVNYDFGHIKPVVCTATGSITTQNKVNILPGADVSFHAGSGITLLNGFAVKHHAVFHASIIP
ncbi:3-coathanger stack domain-containing protein, partial [Thiolapillus sp.]